MWSNSATYSINIWGTHVCHDLLQEEYVKGALLSSLSLKDASHFLFFRNGPVQKGMPFASIKYEQVSEKNCIRDRRRFLFSRPVSRPKKGQTQQRKVM